MARYKPIHKGMKLLPVDFDRQVQLGSFEHALCFLADHELDLTPFHARYKNDVEGAPAFDPAALIKIVLLAYSRGIVSSRKSRPPAARTSCSSPFPATASPTSPPWPPSSPRWAALPPSCLPKC